MFQTLKARRSNNGESAYVVQSSGMPFERSRTKKQRACTLCKLKKLKCVPASNEDSCVKCAKQGLECSYKNKTKSDKTSTLKSSKGAPKSQDTTLPIEDNDPNKSERLDSDQSVIAGDTASITSPADSTPSNSGHGALTFPDGVSFADLLEKEMPFDFWSLSYNDNLNTGNAPNYLQTDGGESDTHQMKLYYDPLGYTQGSNDATGEDSLIQSEGTSKAINQTIATPKHEPSFWKHSFASGIPALGQSSNITGPEAGTFAEIPELSFQEMPALQPASTACQCLEQLMQANEDMQVKLVWGACPLNGVTVSVDEMLQCQKDVLVSCETLLECKACSQRSDYVMLIVSMCHEMMNGIGDLSEMILPGSQQGSSKRPRSESDVRKRDLKVKAGAWRLDDEEEINVIRSLIGIRITRLGSLITLLEKGVKVNHPAYEWVIRALRQSITEKVAAIGPGGPGGG
ncbi:hypothetical protein F5B22DRAFT_656645 [Xylaria bambusicola]|uniref:uncharacterized protein n=1 Tax=Xylaria bambusicola TaxID=326684 RepID=UPI0020077DD9|nr:uncharacterized protein F5B22DRAFT_656645 [Xylaria bambusicola]KAI0514694.1 hypothetical protein F5B22DRAFT_656645 [Xylaria bambusicola]